MTRLRDAADETVAELAHQHTARTQDIDARAEEVVRLFNEKITEIDEDLDDNVSFVDDRGVQLETEEPVLTETENERDKHLQIAQGMKKKILNLQLALAEAEAAAAPAVIAAAVSVVVEWWDDLQLEFEAATEQLPGLEGEPTGTQKDAVDKLKALFRAVPWGSALPSVQFEQLGVQPCFFHGLVGDTIWQACWGDRHHAITLQHAVPYKLLNVARHVVEGLDTVQTDAQLDEGKTRYLTVHKEAERRKAERRGPY